MKIWAVLFFATLCGLSLSTTVQAEDGGLKLLAQQLERIEKKKQQVQENHTDSQNFNAQDIQTNSK